MEQQLITIYTFSDSSEANLTKNLLENNGITSFLTDEHLSTVNPYYSSAIGNIKLQISSHDYENAKLILIENGFNIFDKDDESNISAPPCPKCDSRKVYPKPMSMTYLLLGIIFLLIPILTRTKYYKCYDCNYLWKETASIPKIIVSIFIGLIIALSINELYKIIIEQ